MWSVWPGQAARWQPPFLAVLDDAAAVRLREMLPAGYHPQILIGREGYARLAALPEAAQCFPRRWVLPGWRAPWPLLWRAR